MASVLSDQFIKGSVVAPLAPVTTSLTAPQFNSPSNLAVKNIGRTGNATVLVPSPTLYSNGENVRRYRYTIIAEITTTTTTNITLSLQVNDTAGTATTIASSGAQAVNTAKDTFCLEVDFIIDANTGFGAINGAFQGYGPATVVARTLLSAQPVVVLTGAQPLQITPLVSSSAVDAGSVFQVVEMTLELL